MRILVIGGTGFLGRAIVERLVSGGHRVAVFHRGITAPDFHCSVEQIVGNRDHLPKYREQFQAFNPEIVVDCIAGTGQQMELLMNTFRGIARRVIVLSSGDVYFAYDVLFRKEPGPIQPTPLKETALLRMRRYPYRGLSMPSPPWVDLENYEKIDVERAALSNSSLPATILRLPMVYGPGADEASKRRFYPYHRRMDGGRPAIPLNHQMAEWRAPWGHTANITHAVALAVENDRAAGQVYNVAERGANRIADWIKNLAIVTNWRGRIVRTSRACPPPDMSGQLNLAQHIEMDSTKIRTELGYREVVGRLEGLMSTVTWEREHPPRQVDPRQFDYASEDALLASTD